MTDEGYLLSHIEDLYRRAAERGCAWSRFLSPAEQTRVSEAYTRRRDASLSFYGGAERAERRLAVFTQPDWGQFDPAEAVTALSGTVRGEEAPGHRDVLGALMAQGIKREVLGDIYCTERRVWILCATDMAGYLCSQVERLGRAGVKLAPVPLSDVPSPSDNAEAVTVTVASLRLDAVLAAAFRLSRGDAADAVTAGRVQVDHRVCDNPARALTVGQLVTLRGAGRVRLVGLLGETRKGRVRLELAVNG